MLETVLISDTVLDIVVEGERVYLVSAVDGVPYLEDFRRVGVEVIEDIL